MSLHITPLTRAIGAEVGGIAIRDPDNTTFARVQDALHRHEVLFFRGAHLTDEEHMALARRFGRPSIYPPARLRGVTEPTLTTIEDGPDSPPEADMWHTDVTWVAEPPRYALLCSLVTPDSGGDTMWSSMTAAYEALSPTVRESLGGLRVVHDSTTYIDLLLKRIPGPKGEALARQHLDAFPPVSHPLVRTQPETGRRSLFLSPPTMSHVEGLHDNESRALLSFLSRHIEDSRFHVRWRWSVGDLAIWDERSTCHRAVGEHFPQRRAIRRIEIDGDRPS